MKKKVLIYGIGSLQNRGCEALVNSTLNQIDENYEIVAASFDYEHDKKMYKDRIKKYVDHHKQDESKFNKKEKELLEYYKSIKFDYYNYESLYERDVIKELKDSDICMHLGGDNYCYGVNEWIYTITRKAKELNKKIVLWGASLYDEILDKDLIDDLNRYDLLMIRESISYNAIKKYISEEKLMLIPDPAFSLKPKAVELDTWYSKRKIVGLNLSPLTIKTDEQYNSVKELINYILKNTEYSIALLPHVTLDEASDLKVLSRLDEDYKKEKRVFLETGNYDCQELKYIISKCDMLITARTHASIAAYSSCIPTLVIGYSVKSRGIAQDIFGSYKDYVLPANEINPDSLIEKFNYIRNNYDSIKKYLNSKMKTIIKESSSLFIKMNEKLESIDERRVCDHNKCTGCTACLNACPKNAIKMVKNEEGFLIPKIDLKKCVHCNICRNICPVIKTNDEKYNMSNIECYAAKSKNKDVIMKSSSGGIFYHLAKEVLKHNGIVYGAMINNNIVSHTRVDDIKDLEKIHGSKYSQSELDYTFRQVKEDLENNKKVIFSGTPCQILGIKKYLKKEYKNLILVSVICHGVMNDKLLNKRVKEFENKFDTKIEKVIYKSKKNGWDNSSIEFKSERIDKCYKFSEDPLMNLYIKNYILRESCYRCPAKGINNNVADIILGDYWGVYYEHNNMFDKLGTSAIILKTEKAKRIFNKIKSNLILEKTKYENIIKYNEAFIKSMDRPRERTIIFKQLENNTIEMINERYSYDDEKIKTDRIQKEQLQYQLNEVLNSKRYKLVDKVARIKNKIINRGR